jgi:hypothetical protein
MTRKLLPYTLMFVASSRSTMVARCNIESESAHVLSLASEVPRIAMLQVWVKRVTHAAGLALACGNTSPQTDVSDNSAPADGCLIDRLDCTRYFEAMTGDSLRLDSARHPHVICGGSHLSYTWKDKEIRHRETVDRAHDVSYTTSLTLERKSNPHISRLNTTTSVWRNKLEHRSRR